MILFIFCLCYNFIDYATISKSILTVVKYFFHTVCVMSTERRGFHQLTWFVSVMGQLVKEAIKLKTEAFEVSWSSVLAQMTGLGK